MAIDIEQPGALLLPPKSIAMDCFSKEWKRNGKDITDGTYVVLDVTA